jgi:hypothetical protein
LDESRLVLQFPIVRMVNAEPMSLGKRKLVTGV